MARRCALLLAIASVALTLTACGGGDGGDTTGTLTLTPAPNPPGNLLINGSFEQGGEPWMSLDPESNFQVTDAQSLDGHFSARLQMNDDQASFGDRVYDVAQEITPGQMPEVIRGAYRVENWQRGTAKQYLQFAVIAYGPDNFPTTVDNWQLRYLLAGVEEAPLIINNARYLKYSGADPVQDTWVTFEAPIRKDFLEQWQVIPQGFEKLRLLFEVRFDDKTEADGVSRADVYYDNLYIGDGS